MGIFGSKFEVWIPENEKLKEKIEDPAQWDAKESFVGWKVCNDGKLLAQGMAAADGCGSFDFSFNGLGDNEAIAIAKTLTNLLKFRHAAKEPGGISGKITKLNLANNFIHAAGVKAIADALVPEDPRTTYSLEELDLQNNAAGAEGAMALGEMMKKNRVLRKLNLAWNNIGNQGIFALAKSLQPNHKSFRMDIRYNTFDVTDEEIEWDEMVKHLKQNIGKENIPVVLIGWDETDLYKLL
mmetsp:Transcript_50132/g.102218  ORF Transcript_50132/g.102218 Transcript_50132/m.102218 type:complete len:239 (+) Transcript_50132:51-767(+)